MGITNRKLTAIVIAMPTPTQPAKIAPRSTNRLTRALGRRGHRRSRPGNERPRPASRPGPRGTPTSRANRERAGQRLAAEVPGAVAQLLFDPEKPVVLRDALRARRGPGLDLAGPHGHDEVGGRGVLGLAGAVADLAGPAGPAGHVYRSHRLGEGPDLVELDQD